MLHMVRTQKRDDSAESGPGTKGLPQMTASDAPAAEAGLQSTPLMSGIPFLTGAFETLTEALDYAATGATGYNFHDARANLLRAYPYAELRDDARANALRLIGHGVKPGDRVALIAETGAEFAAAFYGALYAGVLPVPLPLPTSFGGRQAYVEQIRVQLTSSDPVLVLGPDSLLAMFAEAADGIAPAMGWSSFADLPAPPAELPPADPNAIAYLQYSSGSTRFPHGVAVSHRAVMANLTGHALSMEIAPGDRGVSWLPWYHDMGLVGTFLSPMAVQMSVDFLATDDFARRPLSWLTLISRNPGNSLSYSPTFGYDICARRVSTQTDVVGRFDLSRWRIAGNGADMIRPDICQAFVDAFAPAGFRASAFTPSYGLAEATLAVSVAPVGQGIVCDLVDEKRLAGDGFADTVVDAARPTRYRAIVDCGVALTGLTIEIRNADGRVLPDRQIGRVLVKGVGLMDGYFRDPEATAACLSPDGWLDTGDMGYLVNGHIFIVGRAKDMIILNGKNHWPQDIEWAIEQLEGFKAGDIAAFSITTPQGEEAPAVLVQCRTTDDAERARLKDAIRQKVRAITGMNCVVELVPPRTLPRTSSGKLSRVKARALYLSGEIVPFDVAA
jgi:fatty-acyl-CoA synthase